MILGIYNHSGWSGECMTCHILFLSRPFWATVCKMVPLCYQTAVCPVYDVGVLWPNGWMDHGSPLQKGHSPQFSAHICCGQKAGCIKDSTWYGGRPRPRRHCVRWGPCPPPKKRGTSPPILAHILSANGCMDQDATWWGDRPRSRPHCITWGPTPSLLSPQKGAQQPPLLAQVYCG